MNLVPAIVERNLKSVVLNKGEVKMKVSTIKEYMKFLSDDDHLIVGWLENYRDFSRNDWKAICERIDKYSWELIIETWQVMIDEAYSEVLTERKTR